MPRTSSKERASKGRRKVAVRKTAEPEKDRNTVKKTHNIQS